MKNDKTSAHRCLAHWSRIFLENELKDIWAVGSPKRIHDWVCGRVQREFSIPGILDESKLHFTRLTTRNDFLKSRKLRSGQKILNIISKPENEDNKSRSPLNDRDWKRIVLDLVSKPENKCQKFSSCLDVRDWIGEVLILVSKLKKWLWLTSGLW